MAPDRSIRRAAMTLVELLIVVAIMLLISVASIPLLAPNDDQKGREAALTATTAVARAVARAEDNGTRGAGIWLEPLDADRDGRLPSRGILDLFACQSQDDYQGDDPELEPRVFVQAVSLPPPPGWLTTDSVLLFSDLTSANIREYCLKASRITIPRGGTEYYFRLLTPEEQPTAEGQLRSRRLLPAPYIPPPPSKPDEKWVGWYRPKRLEGDGGNWQPHSGRPLPSGDVLLAYARAIPPADRPPDQSSPGFFPGVPEGAIYSVGDGETPEFDPPLTYVRPANLPAVDTGETYTIRRPTTRSATPPLALPAGFGVDLAWSTYGANLLTDSARVLPGTGSRLRGIDGLLSNRAVCIMFSQAKDVAALVFHREETIAGLRTIIEERVALPGDVYLLIGRLDRAGNAYVPNPSPAQPGANWQYPDSRWVRISRTGGATLIADPMLGVDNVYESQGYARLGLQAAKQ